MMLRYLECDQIIVSVKHDHDAETINEPGKMTKYWGVLVEITCLF